jgi:hypothetical protein
VHYPHFQPQSPAQLRCSDWPHPSLCLACPLSRRRENLEIGQETSCVQLNKSIVHFPLPKKPSPDPQPSQLAQLADRGLPSPSPNPATRNLLLENGKGEKASRAVETRFFIAPPLARDKKTIADPAQAEEAARPTTFCCNRFLTRNGNCGSLHSVQDSQPPSSCHQRSIPSSISNPPNPSPFFIYSSAIFIESPITSSSIPPNQTPATDFGRTLDGAGSHRIGPQPPGSPLSD